MKHSPAIDTQSLQELGAEIILTAIRDAEWLTNETLSRTQRRHLYGGTVDPLAELQEFADDGVYEICHTFGLAISADALSSKINALLRRAREVRVAFPYSWSGRESYETSMWQEAA